MRSFETTTCYHCHAESTGREHVPPKCLFPKASGWSKLMTVPSCRAHNNATSKADEYLKFLLGASSSSVPGAIRRSAARSAVRLAQMNSRSLHRYGLQKERNTLVIEKDFPLDFELLSACLKKMARALYFYHHCGRQKLLINLDVWPLFIPIDPLVAPELASEVREIGTRTAIDFEQHPRLGSHQEIFAYQVIESPEMVIVNMEFYGADRASVIGTVA